MLNNVTLTGRLTKDPEMKVSPTGTKQARFTLAVNRTYKNSEGVYEADFIPCVAWKELAEVMGNNTNKGMLIGVTGRLRTRSYESEGVKHFIMECAVESFTFLEKKKEVIDGTQVIQYQ